MSLLVSYPPALFFRRQFRDATLTRRVSVALGQLRHLFSDRYLIARLSGSLGPKILEPAHTFRDIPRQEMECYLDHSAWSSTYPSSSAAGSQAVQNEGAEGAETFQSRNPAEVLDASQPAGQKKGWPILRQASRVRLEFPDDPGRLQPHELPAKQARRGLIGERSTWLIHDVDGIP